MTLPETAVAAAAEEGQKSAPVAGELSSSPCSNLN